MTRHADTQTPVCAALGLIRLEGNHSPSEPRAMVDGPHGLGTHGLGTQVSPLRPASAPPRAATPASPRTARAAPESSSTRTRTLIGVMAGDTASATPVDGGVERAAAPAARESAAVAQATRRAMASVTGLCGCGCARGCLAIGIRVDGAQRRWILAA